tara:strand:- start:1197 stop:1559 length:363 start_codon:yes stop_codon:yes gene_type:complete
MYPGKHSDVNPGNFRGSEVMKYSALKMMPMKFEDQKGTGPGITQADVVSARKDGYNAKMYSPMDHKNADGTHKAKEMPMIKTSNSIDLGGGKSIGRLDLRSQKVKDQKDIIVGKPKKYNK